jgi:hypothetical protein
MTQREKTLATGLVVLLGVAVSGGLLWFLGFQPYAAAREAAESQESQLREKENELTTERAQINSILKVAPRLRDWDKISLSPRDPKVKFDPRIAEEQKKRHVSQLQVDYEKYLAELLQKKGFRSDSISVQLGQVEKQAVAKGKQPTYERIAFRVTGRGELSSVTGFLEEFHKTPLLHQVRNVTVETANARGGSKFSDSELEMKATVEALLVTGAKERATLLPPETPKPLLVMADPERDYHAMSLKNMFTGIKPPPKKKEERTKTEEEKEKERKEARENARKEKLEDVLAFVKLTMLCYDTENGRWYATVYDQAKGGNETKLSRALNELTVYDKYSKVSLDAKVVHIDGDQLIFCVEKGVEKRFFRLKIGDFVYPTYPNKPMSAAELKALGISAE